MNVHTTRDRYIRSKLLGAYIRRLFSRKLLSASFEYNPSQFQKLYISDFLGRKRWICFPAKCWKVSKRLTIPALRIHISHPYYKAVSTTSDQNMALHVAKVKPLLRIPKPDTVLRDLSALYTLTQCQLLSSISRPTGDSLFWYKHKYYQKSFIQFYKKIIVMTMTYVNKVNWAHSHLNMCRSKSDKV